MAGTGAAAAEATKKNYFGLPEWDDGWLEMVEKDANGNLVPKVGAPPDVIGRIQTYQRALRAFNNKFYSDPRGILSPVIQDIIQPILEKYVQQNMGAAQGQAFAHGWIQQNSEWLHMKDTQGNVLLDPITKEPILTPEGQRFNTHLQTAVRLGITSGPDRMNYAMDMLRGEYYQQQANKGGSQGANGAANGSANGGANQGIKDTFLQQHNRRAPNHGGSTTPPNNPNAGNAAQNANASLADRMRANLAAAGIKDADIAAGDER